MNEPLLFVVPGDLHLTEAGKENHLAALWMVDEMNDYVRPDFVQFIGDNVQNAAEDEFALFNDVARRLQIPYHVLVGDHDVFHDSHAVGFRRFVAATFGASSCKSYRFVRLNTREYQPLGLSLDQLHWFRAEVEAADHRGEKVVLFQHHYPFKVYEQFAGPGIEGWREIVRSYPPVHTAGKIPRRSRYRCIGGSTLPDGIDLAVRREETGWALPGRIAFELSGRGGGTSS
jgi:Icc protein